MRARLFVAAVMLFSFATGCGRDACQMVVVVASDMDVPADMDEVRVVVEASDGALVAQHDFSLTGGASLPASFGVVLGGSGDSDEAERGSLGQVFAVPGEPFRLEASAMLGGSALVSTLAVTSFVPGQISRLDLFLAARCRTETCEAGQTCRQAGCEDPQIDSSDLPRWDGE